MNTQITLVKQTSNAKTGKMAVTIANTPGTCPSECPFKNGGCYAQNGPSGMHSRKALKANNDVAAFVRGLPANGKIRHFVSGDICRADDSTDSEMIQAIVESHRDRPDVRGIAYTHAYRREDVNAEYMNSAEGLTYNASCETHEDVLEAHALGWDAVMVIPVKSEVVPKEDRIVDFPEYARVVCPATYNDKANCANCMLCGKKGRTRKGKKLVVAFPVHGAQSAKAAAAINAKTDFSPPVSGYTDLPMIS